MSEYGDDQKKLASFRRRLESLKEELQDQLELMNEEDTFTETLTKAFLDREATGNGFIEIGRKVNGQIGLSDISLLLQCVYVSSVMALFRSLETELPIARMPM